MGLGLHHILMFFCFFHSAQGGYCNLMRPREENNLTIFFFLVRIETMTNPMFIIVIMIFVFFYLGTSWYSTHNNSNSSVCSVLCWEGAGNHISPGQTRKPIGQPRKSIFRHSSWAQPSYNTLMNKLINVSVNKNVYVVRRENQLVSHGSLFYAQLVDTTT